MIRTRDNHITDTMLGWGHLVTGALVALYAWSSPMARYCASFDEQFEYPDVRLLYLIFLLGVLTASVFLVVRASDLMRRKLAARTVALSIGLVSAVFMLGWMPFFREAVVGTLKRLLANMT